MGDKQTAALEYRQDRLAGIAVGIGQASLHARWLHRHERKEDPPDPAWVHLAEFIRAKLDEINEALENA